MEEDDEQMIKKMTIEDDKIKITAPFHVTEEGGQTRTVYSDHNPMILETNYVLKEIKKVEDGTKSVMTPDGYKKYKEEIDKEKVSAVWDKDASVQQKYTEWSQMILNIKEKHETVLKPKAKRKSKTMRMLLQEKKKLKIMVKTTRDEELEKRIKILKERIIKEKCDRRYRRLIKTCEKICKKGQLDSGGFWQLQKKMK